MTPAPVEWFDYRARVVKVVDGDTLDLAVDLGFHLVTTDRFRLYGVNTPEDNAGRPATEFVAAWVTARRLRVRTYRADGFRRWLGWVYDADTGEDLSDAILGAGMGVPYPAPARTVAPEPDGTAQRFAEVARTLGPTTAWSAPHQLDPETGIDLDEYTARFEPEPTQRDPQ